MSEPLAIYLNDHLGGAQTAVHLLEAMCDQHEEEMYREFAKKLLPDIQADDNTLRSIIGAIAEEPSGIKSAGGWLLEKLTRLKLGHTGSADLEMFESLEMLSLGSPASAVSGGRFRLFRKRMPVFVSMTLIPCCVGPKINFRP